MLSRLREMSRLAILPLTEEASGQVDDGLDTALDRAAGDIGVLVKSRPQISTEHMRQRICAIGASLLEVLPCADSAKRVATCYAMLGAFAELVEF